MSTMKLKKYSMDFLVIHTRQMAIYSSMLANGPTTIASFVNSNGYIAKLIDDNSQYKQYTDKKLLDSIQKYSPRVIGLGIDMLNAFSSYRLLSKIRQRFPEIIVVAGGLHSYDSAEEIAENDFDLTFFGEAENAILKFFNLLDQYPSLQNRLLFKNEEFINHLKLVPGLKVRSGDTIFNTGPAEIVDDLDSLPFLNPEVANLEDYVLTPYDYYGTANTLNFQRGCPFACTYCKADFMLGKIRNNSASYIVSLVKSHYETYGITQFNFSDSNFPINRKRVEEFCALIEKEGLKGKLSFWCQTSVTITMSDDLLRLMKDAGFTMISVGVERFDTNFRELMKKAGTRQQAYSLIRQIKGQGIKTNVNILINFPEDTVETIRKESIYLDEFIPFIDYYGINYLVPLPGTEIYDSAESTKKWYLRPEIFERKLTYYEIAMNVTTAGVEFNLFGLPQSTIEAMRKFKEKFYFKSMMGISKSPIFRLALIGDFVLVKVSCFLNYISPVLEHTVFAIPKYLRSSGAKLVMKKYIMSASEE
jgi:anaerobic magnesium-protoporphyrin IX monomethyl ester cyclase